MRMEMWSSCDGWLVLMADHARPAEVELSSVGLASAPFLHSHMNVLALTHKQYRIRMVSYTQDQSDARTHNPAHIKPQGPKPQAKVKAMLR